MERVLREHARRYPLMEPVDAVKLLYQAVFGPGHLVTDSAGNYERLKREFAACRREQGERLLEDIGEGMARISLKALEEPFLQQLQSEFERSAATQRGSPEKLRRWLEEKLQLLERLTAEGAMPFSEEALSRCLEGYRAAGYPAVSHSKCFREAYAVAYRVVDRRLSLLSLMQEMQEHKACDRPLVVAIDGRCCAGKSTLARFLADTLGCGVLHLDDFFLRPEQRTPERYATPGENVDHERFLEEVLLPLCEGRLRSYRAFDCHRMALSEPVVWKERSVVVVEGSYACHASLWDYEDIHVFLDAGRETQRERVRRRNPDMAETFFQKWIPLEEQYLKARPLETLCDYHLILALSPRTLCSVIPKGQKICFGRSFGDPAPEHGLWVSGKPKIQDN